MLKKTIFSLMLILVFGVFTVFFCNKIIEENAKIYPLGFKNTEVALVLGTAKILENGKVNLFFKYRIQKAVELYDSGKIKFFVVSGDNGSKEYDEPRLMKNELIKAGIPATRIFCDYAGFSTIDSVLRMKLIFQQTTFYIISQKFHVDRALLLDGWSLHRQTVHRPERYQVLMQFPETESGKKSEFRYNVDESEDLQIPDSGKIVTYY